MLPAQGWPSLQVGRGCLAAPASPSPASRALRLPPASRGRPLCALDSSACIVSRAGSACAGSCRWPARRIPCTETARHWRRDVRASRFTTIEPPQPSSFQQDPSWSHPLGGKLEGTGRSARGARVCRHRCHLAAGICCCFLAHADVTLRRHGAHCKNTVWMWI